MFNPVKARVWIHRNKKGLDNPMICRHCTSPPCGEACPTGAILKDKDTGIVTISEEDCINCYECVKACPFSAVRVDPETGDAFKCDLCGGNPECAQWCPTGAITYVDQGAFSPDFDFWMPGTTPVSGKTKGLEEFGALVGQVADYLDVQISLKVTNFIACGEWVVSEAAGHGVTKKRGKLRQ